MTQATADTPKVLASGLFAGKSAIVTGAGSGIGRAIAIRLVQLGMRVTGIGRRVEALEETARLVEGMDGGFDHFSCNVRDSAEAAALVERVGAQSGLDLLVNNAGGQFFAPAVDISRRGWDSVIDLNLTSVFVLTKAAHPFLKASRGAVVNISLSGVDRGSMGLAHSIAARAGVLGLTRTLALEWAADGIRLNCIGPGTVVTAGFSDEADASGVARLIDATPLGRATTAGEVAELTAFLASPAGAMMSGQLIQIDGAAHLGAGLNLFSGH